MYPGRATHTHVKFMRPMDLTSWSAPHRNMTCGSASLGTDRRSSCGSDQRGNVASAGER